MQVHLLTPGELDAERRADWAAHQLARGLDSPFLTPGWLDALETAEGPDAGRIRIAVCRSGGSSAYLPLRAGAVSRAPGAPLCDYQGLVGPAAFDLEASTLLRALKARRLDFAAFVDPPEAVRLATRAAAEGFVIDLSEGVQAYTAEKRRAGSDVLKDVAKSRRKREREGAPPLVFAEDRNPEAFEQLIAWKRQQYRSTGQTDIFARPWTIRLLKTLLASGDPACRARLFTLRSQGRVVAAHLALCGRASAHAWFIAHDPDEARFSPGAVLLAEMIAAAPVEGWREIDLGPGDYRFKRRFSTRTRKIHAGFLGRPSAAALAREAFWRLRSGAEALPLGAASALPAKAMRRLDLLTALS